MYIYTHTHSHLHIFIYLRTWCIYIYIHIYMDPPVVHIDMVTYIYCILYPNTQVCGLLLLHSSNANSVDWYPPMCLMLLYYLPAIQLCSVSFLTAFLLAGCKVINNNVYIYIYTHVIYVCTYRVLLSISKFLGLHKLSKCGGFALGLPDSCNVVYRFTIGFMVDMSNTTTNTTWRALHCKTSCHRLINWSPWNPRDSGEAVGPFIARRRLDMTILTPGGWCQASILMGKSPWQNVRLPIMGEAGQNW